MTYTYGAPDGSHESQVVAVCEHGSPLGWACHPCALRDGGVFTKPAGPKHHDIYRAVCDCCGSRVWLTEPPPERIEP